MPLLQVRLSDETKAQLEQVKELIRIPSDAYAIKVAIAFYEVAHWMPRSEGIGVEVEDPTSGEKLILRTYAKSETATGNLPHLTTLQVSEAERNRTLRLLETTSAGSLDSLVRDSILFYLTAAERYVSGWKVHFPPSASMIDHVLRLMLPRLAATS